jgi:hypothetical protein
MYNSIATQEVMGPEEELGTLALSPSVDVAFILQMKTMWSILSNDE